jgi:hypothetical protein
MAHNFNEKELAGNEKQFAMSFQLNFAATEILTLIFLHWLMSSRRQTSQRWNDWS